MEQSLKARRKKAQSVFYKALFRFLIFKISSKFYSKKKKEEKLGKLNESLAKKVGDVIMELEGLFIKVAQQISTMSNLLPNEYTKALQRAQNHSNPKPFYQPPSSNISLIWFRKTPKSLVSTAPALYLFTICDNFDFSLSL